MCARPTGPFNRTDARLLIIFYSNLVNETELDLRLVLFVGSERDRRALEYLVSVSDSEAVLRGYRVRLMSARAERLYTRRRGSPRFSLCISRPASSRHRVESGIAARKSVQRYPLASSSENEAANRTLNKNTKFNDYVKLRNFTPFHCINARGRVALLGAPETLWRFFYLKIIRSQASCGLQPSKTRGQPSWLAP